MSSFTLLTPPALEPITLDEAKAHARIDTDADDALVSSLITAARQWAEKTTGRAFIDQTWQAAFDEVPLRGFLRLPRAPLQSILSVQSYDDADNAVTWAAGNYFTDTLAEPGRLVLRSGASWPSPTRAANGLIVTYKCGYGPAAQNVPQPIRTALLQLVAYWYDHRGDSEQTATAPALIHALLAPYRLRGMGA